MATSKNLKISKLDAAKRQLETVIRLYFASGDPVSIHTLTAAAYNIIRDVNKNRGGDPLFAKDRFLNHIKEGHENDVRILINAAENFFKHADRDHDSTIDFNPDQSEFLIFEGCIAYRELTGESPPLLRLFEVWFIAQHPKYFKFNEENQRAVNEGASAIVGSSRESFFTKALPIFMRPHA